MVAMYEAGSGSFNGDVAWDREVEGDGEVGIKINVKVVREVELILNYKQNKLG